MRSMVLPGERPASAGWCDPSPAGSRGTSRLTPAVRLFSFIPSKTACTSSYVNRRRLLIALLKTSVETRWPSSVNSSKADMA